MPRALRNLMLAFASAPLVLALAACPEGGSNADSPADSLTQRQKDSIVGESSLPGAGGVRDMIEASDRQKARADRLDSLSGNR